MAVAILAVIFAAITWWAVEEFLDLPEDDEHDEHEDI